MSASNEDLSLIGRVADELPLGIWVAKAATGEEVYANARFAEIMGVHMLGDVETGKYAEPYGIHDREGNLYPESRMPFVRALQEGGRVEVDDIVIHRPDGSRIYVRASAEPMFDPDGNPQFVAIAFIDITLEAQAREQEERSRKRAERAARMESVGNLAGGVAHDFNNMLAVIRTTAYLIEKENDAEQRATDLTLIRDVTEKAALLTRSLLSFAGRHEGRRQPVRLDEMVAGLAPMLQRFLDRRVEVRIDNQAQREVHADRAQLEQIVMNLVFNAHDAMPEGGVLDIKTWDEGDLTWLEVRDTGSGIAPEIVERIFDPYFSTKAPSTHRGGGLGLATVYGLVQTYGGSIDVETQPGQGTCMRVQLPSEPVAEQPPTTDDRPAQRFRSSPGKVLLAEDTEAVRKVIVRALHHLGFETLTAADGLEAVELFEAHHHEVDLVLLDMKMPRLDGRGALEQMRSINPDVPVVVLTGYAADEDRQAILALGVDACLSKPVNIDVLDQELNRVIQQRAPAPPPAAPT